MKILIAGLGSIGKRHLKNLLALGVKDIIIYRHFVAGEPSDFPVFADIDEALAQKPDAILIANPTAFHIPVAISAANAGINIFMEKPVSHNLEKVPELIKIIEEKKLIALVGYQFRFHPALQKIKEMVSSGQLGKIIFGRAEVGQYLPDWHTGEDYRRGYAAREDLGGGVILTLIHELDYLSWILGESAEVNCTAGHFSGLEIDTEDLAEITIKYKSGALGQCHLDYLQKSPSRWLKIVGEKGEIYWDYFENKVKFFDGKWQTIYKDENFDRNEMFLAEMKHFINCLEGKERPSVDIASDLATFNLALGAKLSAKENKIIKLK